MQAGGSELDAPSSYAYSEYLEFMKPFSIKTKRLSNVSEQPPETPTVSPQHLYFKESSDNTNDEVLVKYTAQFLDLVRQHPELYDEFSEMKKYTGNDSWKNIADQLGKFKVGKLRQYWKDLMRKYKFYMKNIDEFRGQIDNEEIFDQLMTFAGAGYKPNFEFKTEDNDSTSEITMLQHNEPVEEHLVGEEIDDSQLEETQQSIDEEEEIPYEMVYEKEEATDDRDQTSEETAAEPQEKRMKFATEETFKSPLIISKIQYSAPPTTSTIIVQPPPESPSLQVKEDDFDFFGRKVATQLREIAQKNVKAARRGEVKVLQMLLEIEDSLDT